MLYPIRTLGNQPEISGLAETAARRHAVGIPYSRYMLKIAPKDRNPRFERNGEPQDDRVSNEAAVGLSLALNQRLV